MPDFIGEEVTKSCANCRFGLYSEVRKNVVCGHEGRKGDTVLMGSITYWERPIMQPTDVCELWEEAVNDGS